MRLRLLALFVLIGFVSEAQPGYTSINSGYNWLRGRFNSGLHVPGYNGAPSTVATGVWIGDGAVAVDTANHRFYIYSGGSWRRVANYSEVTAITPTPKYINILLSGQSNAWGASGPTDHDTAASSRVLIWDHARATPAWVTARINQTPFRVDGYNSLNGGDDNDDYEGSSNSAFYMAKKIADENPFDTVRIVMAIGDGQSISTWFDGTTQEQYTDSLLDRGAASGIEQVDLFLWVQGEADYAMSEASYIAAFDSLKATLRRESWFKPTTPIVVSGLPVMSSSGNNYAKDTTLRKFDYDSDVWVAFAPTTGLTLWDNVHYTASSLDTLGRIRYYQAWKSIPYRNSERSIPPNPWSVVGTKIFYTAGNVGIGTQVPQVGLDLGTTRSLRIQGVQLPTSGKGVEIGFISGGPTGYIFTYDRDAAAYRSMQIGGSIGGGVGTGQFQLYLEMPSGYVGIGNENPDHLLHVGRPVFQHGTIAISGGTSGTALLTVPAAAGSPTLTLPTVTGTISQFAEGTTASSATPAPSGNARENVYDVTALATDPTFAAPSGTAANHNTLLIRIKDDGTPRALSWNAIYREGTDILLPTTTTASKTMYVYFVYNSADSKWDLVGLTDGI